MPNNEPEKNPEFEPKINIPKRQEIKELFNKTPEVKEHTIIGADAATAANYTVFFTAPYQLEILGFSEVHQTAGSSDGTLQLERLQGTEALDNGDLLLTGTIDLTGTANTVIEGTLTTTLANRVLEKGDRLALKDANTLTAVANVSVYVTYKPTGAGHFRKV